MLLKGQLNEIRYFSLLEALHKVGIGQFKSLDFALHII